MSFPDDDDPDTDVLLQEEFSRRTKVPERKGEGVANLPTRLRPPNKTERQAEHWMEEALKHSSTVVRKVEDLDTVRADLDELRGPPRSKVSAGTGRASQPIPLPSKSGADAVRRLAPAPSASTPTKQRMPIVSAEVRHDPSITDEGTREKTAETRPPDSDPGWIAIQSSLAGLAVSAVLGLMVLTGFLVLR